MFVVSLAQPGLAVEADRAAEPSDTGGADFAALMAAMAAASLAPAPAPASPLPVPTTDDEPKPGDTAESLVAGAAALPPAFGWALSCRIPMFAPTPATSPGGAPPAAAPALTAPQAVAFPAPGPASASAAASPVAPPAPPASASASAHPDAVPTPLAPPAPASASAQPDALPTLLAPPAPASASAQPDAVPTPLAPPASASASAQPDALPAPVPAAPAVAPAADAGAPGLSALAGMMGVSGRGIGPTGGTIRAEISQASDGTPTNPAAVPLTGLPALAPAQGAGKSSTDEASGSEPVAATGPGPDRLPTPGAHPGGSGVPMAVGVSPAAGGPTNPTPVQDPPVMEQVVSVVEPLRQRGDGHHELTLDLHPAELGAIRVEVSIDRGTVHLSLHAEQASTGTLLHEAMPELRAALEEAGLVPGRLGVGSGDREGGRPPAPFRPAEGNEPRAGRPQAAAVAAIRPPTASAAGALDLLL
jgi:flagellar hook-length control protein FliK